MDKKIEETREFLQTIGMPKAQQADICCYVILAMAGIKPDMSWSEATNEWIRIHDIIQFVNTFYGMSYAENSRETFRKQALHRFRTAALIEDNGKATNSPNYRYRLTEETVQILRTMETPAWKESIKRFLCYHEKLIDLYASKKKMTMMPVNINGKAFKFSAGKHNELQKANKLSEDFNEEEMEAYVSLCMLSHISWANEEGKNSTYTSLDFTQFVLNHLVLLKPYYTKKGLKEFKQLFK